MGKKCHYRPHFRRSPRNAEEQDGSSGYPIEKHGKRSSELARLIAMCVLYWRKGCMKFGCHNSSSFLGFEVFGKGSVFNGPLTLVNRDVHGRQAGLSGQKDARLLGDRLLHESLRMRGTNRPKLLSSLGLSLVPGLTLCSNACRDAAQWWGQIPSKLSMPGGFRDRKVVRKANAWFGVSGPTGAPSAGNQTWESPQQFRGLGDTVQGDGYMAFFPDVVAGSAQGAVATSCKRPFPHGQHESCRGACARVDICRAWTPRNSEEDQSSNLPVTNSPVCDGQVGPSCCCCPHPRSPVSSRAHQALHPNRNGATRAHCLLQVIVGGMELLQVLVRHNESQSPLFLSLRNQIAVL